MPSVPINEPGLFNSKALIEFGETILHAAGLPLPMATKVAETLVEADLLGHTTHGLYLLPAYLHQLKTGQMTTSGIPGVIMDSGSALTWDGRYLPGPWLVHQAIET